MDEAPIDFFARRTGEILTEEVYGEKWLRWTYGNPLGRLSLWALVKRGWFSRWYGWRMNAPASRERVNPFIETYGVNEDEFLYAADSYGSFNEFFYRRLKPGARPIEGDEEVVTFPADGRHLGFTDVSSLEGVFVKGQRFDLPRLFGSREAAAPYEKGDLVLSRLCPVDYHRYHFPASGHATSPLLLNGCLLSVNPIALRQNLSIFWENKRNLSYLETKRYGRIASFEVGATCVGSMNYSGDFPRQVSKGEEKGWFAFGGSSVLTFFEPGRVRLAEDLLLQSSQQRELYALMGEEMGRAL